MVQIQSRTGKWNYGVGGCAEGPIKGLFHDILKQPNAQSWAHLTVGLSRQRAGWRSLFFWINSKERFGPELKKPTLRTPKL